MKNLFLEKYKFLPEIDGFKAEDLVILHITNLQQIKEIINALMLKNVLEKEKEYYKTIMDESSDGIYIETLDGEIIEKARLFSKLGSEKIEGERRTMDIKNIIQDSINIVQQKYPEAKIINQVKSMKIKALPILKEVFVNILDNAFKYGATKVEIILKNYNNSVEMRFADDGPGIPEDKKEIIFEPFERLSSGSGSVLGLAIVKMIAELHHGKTWIENNKPHVSVFVIRLPKN